MTKNTQNIERFFTGFDQYIDKIPGMVAETAREHYQERFRFKNWDGKPWPKFNPRNNPRRREPTRGSLLMRRNLLFQSVRPAIIRPDLVRMSAGSSKVRYARVHNEGQRVRGLQYVRPHTNENFMGRGQRVQIKGHKKKVDFQMPKRQFMGHSRMLNREIRQRLALNYNRR